MCPCRRRFLRSLGKRRSRNLRNRPLPVFLLGLPSGALADTVDSLCLGIFTVAFATFVWTPLFLAFDAMDPSLGRRQLEWKQKKAVITGNFTTSVSLGLTGTLLLSVPPLNLLGLPVLDVPGLPPGAAPSARPPPTG